MYLEDQIRTIEERLAALESTDRPDSSEELRERLAGLEEKNSRLTKRAQSLESRLEELGQGKSTSDVDERIDQCETTCHDLLNTQQTIRDRSDSFDRRLTGLNKQLEGLLDQLADLDGRHGKGDVAGLESKFRQLESDMQELRSLRTFRTEMLERISDFDRALAKSRTRIDEMDEVIESVKNRAGTVDFSPMHSRIGAIETSFDSLRQMGTKLDALAQDMRRRFEEMATRVDRLDGTTRDWESRWGLLDRESLPTRLRTLEERTQSQEGTSRMTSVAHRLDMVERDSLDVKKEVTWLRDRPQGSRFDHWARVLAGGGLAAGIAAIALWMWPWHTLHAQRFVLVDKDRRELGELASNEHGACLELQDRGGQRRLFLAATGAGSMLTLSDENGVERTRLSADKVAGAGLLVGDPSGSRQIWCGVQNHEPALTLLDGDGQVRGSMSLEQTGAEIALFENAKHPCLKLVSGAVENGLRVYDAGGRLRLGVGMCPDGATVNLFDPKEKRRVVLSSGDQSSALAFLGKDELQRTTLGMTEKDESILNLHDNDGRQRVLLIASQDDAKVEVLDRETNVLFSGP